MCRFGVASGAADDGYMGSGINERVGQACTRSCAAVGASVSLQPLMLVDGDRVTTGASDLGTASVTAEVLAETKGQKIRIFKYKNKTGYRKRQGHRPRYTQVRVTGIES